MEKEQYFTFIVLHYNCFEETKACVDSILALEQSEQTQIVVMDNASVNDSLTRLQQTYGDNPQVHILHNESNEGFSAGNNKAYAGRAKDDRAEYGCAVDLSVVLCAFRKEYEGDGGSGG